MRPRRGHSPVADRRAGNVFAIGRGGSNKPLITLARSKGLKLSVAEERDQRLHAKK